MATTAGGNRKVPLLDRCMTFDGTQRMDAIVEELKLMSVTGSDPFQPKGLSAIIASRAASELYRSS